MDARKRDIVARYLLSLCNLSKCSCPRAAVVSRGERVISIGISQPIIEGKEHETCPIMQAVIDYQELGFGKENVPILFSTYFPSYYEVLLLLQTNIRTIYYMGEITDEKSVSLINAHTTADCSNGFEIIKLKV